MGRPPEKKRPSRRKPRAGPATVSGTTSTVSVIIPAFNEETVIGDVVARVRETVPEYEVIVVDDGSSDDTSGAAAEAGARVLRNPYNVGNGASVKRGIQAATGDIVLMMDGDGQHPPEDIPKLVAAIGDYDMVVGARTRDADTSPLRNFGNRLLNRMAQWISGHAIPDLTSGFRAIKKEIVREYLHLFPNRYSYPTTITLAMILAGFFVSFMPLDSIRRREHGQSNISPVRDFIRFVAIIFRIIILFSPRRIFLPLGLILFALSILVGGLQLWLTGGIQSAGLGLFLSSIYVACFGLLADQIALLRRQRKE